MEIKTERANLVDESGEGRASGPTGQPEQDGVLLRAPLRLDEVVEESRLAHRHVPCFEGEGQGASEPGQAIHRLPAAAHGRRRRRSHGGGAAGAEQQQQQAALL
ncbi:hypothetical protein EE612_022264 [Oryza sativa]|nr:hypothetical protein EE612_022264 [Oryza sativa]